MCAVAKGGDEGPRIAKGGDEVLRPRKKQENEILEMSWITAFLVYMAYAVAVLIGHLEDFLCYLFGYEIHKSAKKGFASLFKEGEDFYTRRLYARLNDCWNRPICSAPGCYIDIIDRTHEKSTGKNVQTGKVLKNCLNLGSYNYLGFADDWHTSCKAQVMDNVDKYPNSMQSGRADLGTLDLHKELEQTVARFVGKEDAVVFPMGFSTNASTIPSIMGPGCLIISDSLNHTSIVNGARASPSQIRVFRHNDPYHLEEVLREAILKGQPKYARPWKKILVMVEGIYSMEGNICNLKEIVRVTKQYKAYLYVDEAHSIGALGKNGRGICEYTGIDPAQIDILMGTFTKSFSGMGGYIAADKSIVDHIRSKAPGGLFHNSMSPTVCSQVLRAFKVILGEDGTSTGRVKLDALVSNSNYFRKALIDMGLHVYGDYDSPIVPILMYNPAKIAAFSRECLARGIAVVVVGFPATSPLYPRARFCVSAGHTREDMDRALTIIDEVSTLLCMKYSKNIIGWA